MSVYDKSVLIVIGVGLFCLFVFSVGLGIGLDMSTGILMDMVYLGSAGRVIATLIGLIFAFSAANMFRMALYRPPSVKAVISETPLGKVKITVDAIRDLVIKAVRQIEGIRSAEVDIKVSEVPEEGLSLDLTLCVVPDIDISAICETVQITLQEYVRATVGISIQQIDVLVKNVAAEKKARVE